MAVHGLFRHIKTRGGGHTVANLVEYGHKPGIFLPKHLGQLKRLQLALLPYVEAVRVRLKRVACFLERGWGV